MLSHNFVAIWICEFYLSAKEVVIRLEKKIEEQ